MFKGGALYLIFFVTVTVIVTFIMILAMLIFYFCLKQQDNHCIRHYDCEFDCDYDKKIRYKYCPKVYLSMEKSCSNCFLSFFFFFFEVPKEICSQCKFPMCSAKCSEEHVKMPECAIMAKHQYFNLSSKFLVLVRTMSRWSCNF